MQLIEKLFLTTLFAAGVLIHGSACAGNDAGDDTLGFLTAGVNKQHEEAKMAAEGIMLKIAGVVAPEEKSSVARGKSKHANLPVGARALVCSGGVCNGVIDCPRGGNQEWLNQQVTSNGSTSGTVTTSTTSIVGRAVSTDCAFPIARIVDGVLVADQTRVQNGITDTTSSTLLTIVDSAAGTVSQTVDADFTATGLNYDGAPPADVALTYHLEHTTVTTGKDVAATVTFIFNGTYNGVPVQGNNTLVFTYKLP